MGGTAFETQAWAAQSAKQAEVMGAMQGLNDDAVMQPEGAGREYERVQAKLQAPGLPLAGLWRGQSSSFEFT